MHPCIRKQNAYSIKKLDTHIVIEPDFAWILIEGGNKISTKQLVINFSLYRGWNNNKYCKIYCRWCTPSYSKNMKKGVKLNEHILDKRHGAATMNQ